MLIVHSHASVDEPHRRSLEKHLAALRHEGLIETWASSDVAPGKDWRAEAEAKMDQADIVLLFLSADYLDSDHCFRIELTKAREAHQDVRARVIPLRLRPVHAGELWFTELAALPTGGAPITLWPNPDQAWVDVAGRIADAAMEISGHRA